MYGAKLLITSLQYMHTWKVSHARVKLSHAQVIVIYMCT